VTRLLSYIARHAVKQSRSHNCATTALRNALLVYERFPVPPCPREGCDEWCIDQTARKLGYRLEHVNCITPGYARSQLRYWHRRGIPSVLCVDRDLAGQPWAHWIACVHSTDRHVYICDSSAGTPTDPQRLPWSQFLARAVTITHLTPTSRSERFDLYGVRSVAC
jgi:hypothetical protein